MIEVKVVALGSVVRVDLPDGSTIADAAREARLDDSLVCEYRGSRVNPADRGSVALENGATLIFTPPALKHGR